MKEKLKRFVELNQLLKEMKAEKDKLKEELLPQFGNEARSVDNFNIYKQKRTTWKLKPEVDEEDIVLKYFEYAKFDLSSFVKKNEVAAKEIADPNTSEVLVVKEKK